MDLYDRVEMVLDQLRPAMEADGGGVTLVSVQNGNVFVRFKGMCLHCPSIELTLKHGIERTLKDKLPNEIREVKKVD